MSKFNEKLAGEVLRSIFTSPSEHKQNKWVNVPSHPDEGYSITSKSMSEGNVCGSQACIAGWAVLHAGWQLDISVDPDNYRGRSISTISPEGEKKDGMTEVDFKDEALGVLGLTRQEGGCLFYTMDERLAVARLYSKIKTGGLDDLLKETEEELQSGGYMPLDGRPCYVYSSTVIDEVYRQAQSEYSPALDILNTLSEPVAETAGR